MTDIRSYGNRLPFLDLKGQGKTFNSVTRRLLRPVVAVLSGTLSAYFDYRQRKASREAVQHLMKLSDYHLRDVGVTRKELREAALDETKAWDLLNDRRGV
ncbi:DUF1127 domain-containing protein [Cucumibacter marinus]|uniref:DUF1127 domain-containing protein n=1 Tax=Cucumibacter marinus TaxID=1121252 RepID=UPI00041F4C91|nr:DUF1127 domain-containing protein [Cucumibacter marinus]